MINMSRQVGHAGQPGMNGSHGAYGSASDSEERVMEPMANSNDG